MKTIFKYAMMAAAAAVMTTGFASCSDDDDNSGELSEKEKTFVTVNDNFVSTTVVPTYKGLADATEDMISAGEV